MGRGQKHHVKVTFKMPDYAAKFASEKGNLMLFVAAIVQTNRGMLFDAEGGRNGHQKWAPLKWRTGMALSLSGMLRRSIGPLNSGGKPGPDGIVRFIADKVVVGTKLHYARLMNDGTKNMPGGVLRPTHAKALMIPIPPGKEFTRLNKEIKSAPAGVGKMDLKAKKKRWQEAKDESVGVDQLDVKIDRLKRAVRVLERGKERDAAFEKLERYLSRRGKVKANQRFIFRKWVRIPARPFDGWNAQDQRELAIALKNKIAAMMKATRR